MEERLALIATSLEALREKLDRFVEGADDIENFYIGRVKRNKDALAVFEADEDLRQAVDAWIAKGKYGKLLDMWVKGLDVDWRKLHGDAKPRKISLPTYPFAKERHWIPEPSGDAGAEQPEADLPGRGPRVREIARETSPRGLGTLIFRSVWTETPVPDRAGAADNARRLVLLVGPASLPDDALAGMTGVEAVRPRSDAKSLDERYRDISIQAFEQIQRLLEETPDKPLLVQVLVSSRGEERLFTGLSGLLRTARRENPRFFGQLIEVDEPVDAVAEILEQEARDAREDWIRRRNGKRWVARWREEVGSPGAPENPWRDRGVYLITGGVGGLGLILAEEIAAGAREPVLILAGRSPMSPDARERFDALAARGARAVHRRADVSRSDEVDALVQGIQLEFGALHGIFHCAGVLHDGFIIRKTAREFEEVLAPKAAGAVNLDRASRDANLDFFVLFSSVSGALGGAGQADYAAANAFMDAFSGYRNERVAAGRRRGRTLSVDWPHWKEGGMRPDPAVERMLWETEGMTAMETSRGIRALVRGLTLNRGRILVMEGDRARIARRLTGAGSERPAPAAGLPAAPRPGDPPLKEALLIRLKRLLGEALKAPAEGIRSREPLESRGIDSILIARLNREMERVLGPLSKTLFYEHRTLDSLADHLIADRPGECAAWAGSGHSAAGRPAAAPPPGPEEAAPSPSQPDGRPGRRILQAGSADRTREPIAVIGIAGRHPRSDSIEAFWENLIAGADCITDIPPDRWPLEGFYEPDMDTAVDRVRSYSRKGGFLKTFSHFDPLFFNISPAEALDMDPQERLMLTVCREAMEDAGYSDALLQDRYDGAVGVFIGVTKSGFLLHTRLGSSPERSRLPVTSFGSMANRVSHQLNLAGPSMGVDAMCASSITAIHEACEHIRRGDCRLALAGAVNLYLHPRTYVDLCQGRLITDEDEVHCFSETGKGFIPGEGVGAVLLKPLGRAEADGDHIEGVISGTGVNHGGKIHGYTAPNPIRQRELIRRVLRRAKREPDDIDYIESAANGSATGDAIEFEALRRVFRNRTAPPCPLGTLKPNIGHLEAASGMSQLTKVLQQMKRGVLAPTRVRPGRLDPSLDWEKSPFRLATEARDWPSSGAPHRALITSVGAGGSGAVMVVEEYIPSTRTPIPGAAPPREQLVPLSARTKRQLKESARRLSTHLASFDAPLPDLAHTLQRGRDAMRFRLAILARDRDALSRRLDAWLENRSREAVMTGDARRSPDAEERPSWRETEARAARALERRDLPALSRLWVNGCDDIDWGRLHDGPVFRRSLPTYPFERRSFWYGPPGEALLTVQGEARPSGESADSPPSSARPPDDGSRSGEPVRSPGETRADLEDVIKEILLLPDEEELDPEATFLDLGLDSIRVVRFIRILSERLDLSLRETLVFDYPTIGALADFIAGRLRPTASPRTPRVGGGGEASRFKERLGRLVKAHEELIPLQVEGSGPVLFCIHPMSGDVGLYAKMAEAAHTRFRVLGIRSRGFLTDKRPLTTIEAMGRYYADIIAAADPQGPCHLLGASMGGTVAHETARRLQLRDQSVETLLLVEAPVIENEADAALWESDETHNLVMNANFLLLSMLHMDPDFRRSKREGRVRWSDIEITLDEAGEADPGALPGRLAALVEGRGARRSRAASTRRLVSMAAIHLANLRALNRHRPEPLPRPGEPRVVLMRSRGADAVSDDVYNPDYLINVQRAKGSMAPFFEGWKTRLPRLETRVMDGENHFDMLHGRAAVRGMADFIARTMGCGPGVAPERTRPVSASAGSKSRDPGDAEKIAVIGMSGRFPGARTPGAFWRLLTEGRSALTAYPGDRGWDLDAIFPNGPDGAPHAPRGGFLDGIDRFDPLFFRIPPKEADGMDPSERLFLQEAWKAVENAGMDPAALSGRPWGVYCGGGGDYTLALKEISGVSPHVTVSGIPGRVSYSLNLTGPCLAVDAGCASSLMAIAQACDHLIAGRCEAAIAGGALIYTTPNLIVAQHRAGVLSPGGRGLALDEGADGMTPGEAAGAVILKPLADALADGDRIHGVIEAWGCNHNGRTNGMAAPSASAESALFSDVHRRFGVDPATIGMVEAGASGTPLGDAVEVRALTEAFGKASEKRGRCALGTVENHIGHAFQASGVSHLLKVLLAFRHREIPPTIHVETPNPAFALSDGPFFINERVVPWDVEEGRTRRAVVNSFGATGANVHLVMSEAPAPATPPAEATTESDGPALIVLSAKTTSALKRRCRDLNAYLARREEGAAPNLSRISANLFLRRGHFPERCALVVENPAQLRTRLAALAGGKRPKEGFVGTASREASPALDALAQQTIRAIANGKQPGKEDLLVLADLYIRGVRLDLSERFSEAERHPLSLPPYPFEERRCWMAPGEQERPSREEAPTVQDETGASPGETAGEFDSLLAAVQAEVMKITGYTAGETDVDAPFIRLGLDSLMSMRLLGTINERFSMDIQLADLLEHDAIRGLALLMANRGARMGVREETRAGGTKPTLSLEGFSGPARWFSDRLARLPDALRVETLAGESAALPDASLESLTQSLAKLTREGVAVFHEGARCYFIAHRSIDIRSVLDSFSPGERRDLLGKLPPGLLIAPVSREQERNLHHSEVMRQSAWNIQHIYETAAAPLEIPLLNKAMAHVIDHHDVLRTRFLELPTTWAQIVAPEADLAFQRVEAADLPDFQERIAAERNRLLRVDKLPVFKTWIHQNDETCRLGFVTHHGLADAFTTTMLFSELMSRYHALSEKRPRVVEPVAEQYWMHSLRQFDDRVYRNGETIRYWREQLAHVEPSMPLPYARDPREVDGRRISAADMNILSLPASLGEEIERFGRAYETNITQLFTAAVAMTLIHGLGAERAVVQFINNQRDRASLINTPGEFTNVLFIPFEMDPDWTVLQAAREVRKRILTSLRHAKAPFADLLAMTGLGDLGHYYRQTGDVILDSADIDAATLDASAKYGRSLFADSLFRHEASAAAFQAVSTIFFQVLKVNRGTHLITTHRKHLFDASEIRQWSALIVRLVEEMIRHPEQRVKEILAAARRPLDRLRRWASRHPLAPRKRTEPGDPRVVQALEKLIRGDVGVAEARRRIDPIQIHKKPARPAPGDAAVRPAPHVVEALERLVDGEMNPGEAKRLIEEATS